MQKPLHSSVGFCKGLTKFYTGTQKIKIPKAPVSKPKEIKVTSLVAQESKIYIVQNESIILETVEEVELIREEIEVFTFKVPKYNNYISNNILSHNPTYGTNYAWEILTAPAKNSLTSYRSFV